ncbi:MAG TPA: metal-dependent transcriptional regulator [Anaerolineales bacterium]|nr:metal-dependent transcriptional regulator [Anaerolineales bacterium]
MDDISLRESLTHVVEDYLKTIYDLTVTSGRATTNQIAERMGVTAASVTNMIQKLAATQPPLLEYRKHRGVVLTGDGEKVALEIIRHHRLLEMYLHQMLGFGWDEVHAEADRLEHVISEEFEERIAATLGDPRHDPHGDPIPTRDLRLPDAKSMQLSQLRPRQEAIVQRVRSSDAELLRYLSELGLKPEAHLQVLEYSPFDENLRLQVEGKQAPVVLGVSVTSQVFVEVIP